MPQVGIYYWTWFANGNPEGGPGVTPWSDKPFCRVVETSPGVVERIPCPGCQNSQVASLVAGGTEGVCYSSSNPNTAYTHAGFLDQLGVDFVIYDETNLSKMIPPEANPMFRDEVLAMEGFRKYTQRKIRSVFMLSIGCWGEQCFGVSPSAPWARQDFFIFKKDCAGAHIDKIAELYNQYPDDFVLLNGKPLLLFYISEGNTMRVFPTGELAFHGYGNIVPTPWDFDYPVKVRGSTYALRDYFSVRWAAVCEEPHDYTLHPESGSDQIWPFVCYKGLGSNFSEVGYASLLAPLKSPNRDINLFNQLVDAGKDKQFLVIRGWNEFSTYGDEPAPSAYTIEPNTCLHLVDTTPGNQDPWYFFAKIKDKLASIHA